jgi:dTDP-4-dehydrorhamnose 3,5-epimerase
MTLIYPQSIPGVRLIKPKRFGDERGFFVETFNARDFSDAGISEVFVQDNHSMSAARGTVRGLHFQAAPHAQSKVVRVVSGAILDIAVDIRVGSPHFGQHVAAELSADNGWQLFIPAGFAHGFQTLTDKAEVLYKVTDYYAPAAEGGLLWNCPELAIDWPIPAREATVNARDANWPGLSELTSPFVYQQPAA